MGAELAIQVDVQISDELRSLVRQHQAGRWSRQVAARPEPDPEPLPEPVPEPPKAVEPAPPWERTALRQDGARPLVFEGLPLYATRRLVPDLPGTAELSLAFHLGRDGTVHVALSLTPPEGLCARPLFAACALGAGEDLADFLRRFAPETCFDPNFATAPAERARLCGARDALRAAFVSMAAECLNPGMMPA